MTDPMKTASERLDELLGPAPDDPNNLPDDIMQAALLVVENLKALERDDGSNAISIARAIATERKRCIGIIDDLMQLTLKMRYAIEIDRLDRANISGFLEACALIKHQVAHGESAP